LNNPKRYFARRGAVLAKNQVTTPGRLDGFVILSNQLVFMVLQRKYYENRKIVLTLPLILPGFKIKSNRVDAEALTGRWRSVVEQVAQVSFTAAA
jgi:hypothetical protein